MTVHGNSSSMDRIIIAYPVLCNVVKKIKVQLNSGMCTVLCTYFINKIFTCGFNFFTLLQAYGEGTGYECRKHVQRLNLVRKTLDDEAHVGSDEGNCMKHDTDSVDYAAEPQHQVVNYVNIFMCILMRYRAAVRVVGNGKRSLMVQFASY